MRSTWGCNAHSFFFHLGILDFTWPGGAEIEPGMCGGVDEGRLGLQDVGIPDHGDGCEIGNGRVPLQ